MATATLEATMAGEKIKFLSVKVPEDVIESARIVAAYRGVSMGELMGEILRPALARMEREEADRRASGLPKRKGGAK